MHLKNQEYQEKGQLIEGVEESSLGRLEIKLTDMGFTIITDFSQDIDAIYEKLQKRLEISSFQPLADLKKFKLFYRPYRYINFFEQIKRTETFKIIFKLALFAGNIEKDESANLYIHDKETRDKEEILISRIGSNIYTQILLSRYAVISHPGAYISFNIPSIVAREIKEMERIYNMTKVQAVEKCFKCGFTMWEVIRNRPNTELVFNTPKKEKPQIISI